MKRREFIAGTLGAAGLAATMANAQADEAKAKPFRVAFLTDIHMLPGRNAPKWLRECLRNVAALDPVPQLIIGGGDMIFDALGTTENHVQEYFALLKEIWAEECSIPTRHCIGNHDIWGWHKPKSETTGKEGKWGKVWAIEELEMPHRYYRFEAGGWQFIVLDSNHPGEQGSIYKGRLDQEQWEWLKETLRSVPRTKPIAIVSHIPILSVAVFFDDGTISDRDWRIPGNCVHLDSRQIKTIFDSHPNVKLCLSGHIHLREVIHYGNVDYICAGAVSGRWWWGTYQDCPPGYEIIDFHQDGTYDHQYMQYGWQPPQVR